MGRNVLINERVTETKVQRRVEKLDGVRLSNVYRTLLLNASWRITIVDHVLQETCTETHVYATMSCAIG